MPKKVRAVPKGYRNLTPCLLLADATKALDFYKKAFGAVEMIRVTKAMGSKIAYAELMIGDSKLMLMDSLGEDVASNSVASLHLYIADVDQVINQAISLGAKLLQVPANTACGEREGCIQDPFGYCWKVASQVEERQSPEFTQKINYPVA